MNSNSKYCPTCKSTYDIVLFRKHKQSLDGLYYQCKSCSKIADARYRLKHHKKQKEYHKIWAASHKEHRKKYYKENPEYRKKAIASAKEWVKNNPNKVKINKKNYEKRKSNEPSYRINKNMKWALDNIRKGNKYDSQ